MSLPPKSTLTYELWDVTSRNMVDWFEDRDQALEAVRAYLDAEEAELVALLVREADGTIVMSPTGSALIDWSSELPPSVRA
jgi:hypothetical protein